MKHVLIICLALVVLGGVYFFQDALKSRVSLVSDELSFEKAFIQSLRQRDKESLEKYLDFNKFSESIAAAIVGEPTWLMDSNPIKKVAFTKYASFLHEKSLELSHKIFSDYMANVDFKPDVENIQQPNVVKFIKIVEGLKTAKLVDQGLVTSNERKPESLRLQLALASNNPVTVILKIDSNSSPLRIVGFENLPELLKKNW